MVLCGEEWPSKPYSYRSIFEKRLRPTQRINHALAPELFSQNSMTSFMPSFLSNWTQSADKKYVGLKTLPFKIRVLGLEWATIWWEITDLHVNYYPQWTRLTWLEWNQWVMGDLNFTGYYEAYPSEWEYDETDDYYYEGDPATPPMKRQLRF